MEDPFLSIRHYNEREVRFAWKYLIENEAFRSALKFVAPDTPIEVFEEKFQNFKSTADFQVQISKLFVDCCIQKSMSKISYEGMEQLPADRPCLLVANHRDIVLDTALLQNYFFEKQRNSSKIAFGDNLIVSPLLDIVSKVNKMFIVKRGGTIREKLLNSKILSDYIRYSIFEEKESVWIAQRNGRTKNGIDKTQQGLVKMFSESAHGNVRQFLKDLNIVPVAISYQYESCDQLKARELALSEQGPYVKQPGEDVASMKQGIFGFKGEVTLVIGQSVSPEIDAIPQDLKPNELICEVCKLIDKQIYKNFKLYPTNFIACDLLDQNQRFADRYSAEQKKEFLAYLDRQCMVPDVTKQKMTDYLLQIYANPVKSAFSIPYSTPFESENN